MGPNNPDGSYSCGDVGVPMAGGRRLLDITDRSQCPGTEIEKAFLLFDRDRTNKISLDNLREISAELGFKMTDDELMDMLIEANPQNDSGNVIDI